MPTPQTPQTDVRPNSNKGFFKALFSRQHQAAPVPPHAPAPTPTQTSAPPGAPARHALQDRFDAGLKAIDDSLKSGRVVPPASAKAMAERHRMLIEQYRQALVARRTLNGAEAEQTVTVLLQKLLVKVEALKAEALQAASPAVPASGYVPVPRDEPLEAPLEGVYVDDLATDPPVQNTVRGYSHEEAPSESLGYSEEGSLEAPAPGPTAIAPKDGGYEGTDAPFSHSVADAVASHDGNYYGSGDEAEEGEAVDPSLLRHYGSGQRPSAPVVADAPASQPVVETQSQKDLKAAYPCRLEEDLSGFQKGAKPLGEGYFGKTYACTDVQGHKLVLKQPIGEPGDKALLKEAKAYKAVGDHPNIAKCHGVGQVGNEAGLILEHIEGKTATDAMSEMRLRYDKGEITPEEYWAVVRYTLKQMVAAQQHMAKAGITHNDLRLDNVMIESATGQVKVIDLGLGTPTNEKIGTAFPYPSVAPEVLAGTAPVAQSDTYMIGNTAHVLGEQHEHTYGLSADTSQTRDDLKDAAKKYQTGKGVPIKAPDVAQQKTRQAPDLAHAIQPEGGPADGPNIVPVAPRASLGNGTPAQRYAVRLAQLEQGVTNAENGIGVQNDAFGGIKKGRTLAASLKPLLAKAKGCAEMGRHDEALGILAEIEARLNDGARAPDAHQLDTLYTDFINRMMSADPAQRLSPEEALNHPFFTASTTQMKYASAEPALDGRAVADEEDELARRLLQRQMQPGGVLTALKSDASPKDRREWLLASEREVKELDAWLPNEALERRKLLETVRKQFENNQKFQGDTPQAKSLSKMLDEARDDRQTRKVLGDRLAALAGQAQHRWPAAPTELAAFEKRVKAASILLKPGGSLEEARALLDELETSLKG
jgi:serine/threonine protein kinase